MNSRERVLRTFGRIPGKADRVPVQFEMCRQLTDHFSKELGIPAHYKENLYEDVTYRISANELRIAMGSDVVVTGLLWLMILKFIELCHKHGKIDA